MVQPRTVAVKIMVTLALIGVGAWGRRYLHAARHVSSCRIGYICSPHIRQYSDLSDGYVRISDYHMLDRPDVDGVIVATPAQTHYEISKFFLERNKNVLIEKPLTLKSRDALSLQRMYKASSSVAMVNHIYLYHPAITKMQSLVKSLGTIRYIDSEGGSFGPFRPDTSALWDWAPHDISLCLYFIGDMPRSVRAWSIQTKRPGTTTDDLIHIELTFPRARAFMKIGSLFPTKRRTLTVFGTKGALVFNDLKAQKLASYKGLYCEQVSYPSYENTEPLVCALRKFVTCIEEKKPLVGGLTTGVQTIQIIDACERSLGAQGRPMRILS